MKNFTYLMITATFLLTTITHIDTRSAIAKLSPYDAMSGSIIAHARGPSDFNYTYDEPFTAEEEPYRKTYLLDKFYENPYPDADRDYHDALLFSGRAVAFGGVPSKPAYFNVKVGAESQTDNNLSTAYTGIGLGVGYSMRVDEMSTPPSPVPGGKIPIKMKASGWAKTGARPPGGTVFADCILTVRELFDGETFQWDAEAGPDVNYGSFEADQIIYLTPSRVDTSYYVNVEVDITATTSVYVYSAAKGEAEAYVDPVFTFDQAAFDALMGANTFPLKEYYVFAFSTGIDLRGNTNPTNSNPWIPLLLLDE